MEITHFQKKAKRCMFPLQAVCLLGVTFHQYFTNLQGPISTVLFLKNGTVHTYWFYIPYSV